jgi:hypothetical protein
VKGQLAASTPAEYIAQLDEPRKSEIAQLHELIRAAAPALTPCVHSGLLGYGPYHYKYASGHEGDTCYISLASNKNYISLYVAVNDAGGYVAERYREALPKASIGKSCIRFTRLSDLDQSTLRSLLEDAAAIAAQL